MEDFLQQYFISPIFERTGYNAVNTVAYAAIALISLYFIWQFLKRKKFDFASREFLLGAAAFVLLGSTARVLTDLTDSGAIEFAANSGGALGAIYSTLNASGVFSYGYLTVTPGIYVITALLFLLCLAVGHAMKNGMFPAYAGAVLWLPCILLLLPFVRHPDFFLVGIALAAVGALAAYFALEKAAKIKLDLRGKLAIFGQALDGAATFTVIDLFSKANGRGYFEQHVLSAGIGNATPLGFGAFFLVKLLLASLIVYLVSKEKMNESDRALVLIVVAIMGFAPGLRDLLRMLCGT